MTDDFYIRAASKRALEIDADISEIQTGLMRAKAMEDETSAAMLMDGLAEARQKRPMLDGEVADYLRQSTPPAAIPQSREEWRAKPVERMTPEDGLEIARGSKYGAALDWNDPGVRAGWQEAQRRRSRGE
jgi:hypothetical protein